MKDSSIVRTTSTMLAGLLDVQNETAWREFDERYRPVLHAVARRMGLVEADAEDVAQEAMLQFVRDYRRGRYDRRKGRLRSWIQGILRNRILDLMRRQQRMAGTRGESVLRTLAEEPRLEEAWEAECRRKILDDALALLAAQTDLKPSTIEAFRLYALEDIDAREVASRLGIPLATVYLSKHRCARKLQEIVSELTVAYEEE
ncbi:MAG: RNA polymerase sigma factor [Planctomycetota bacterium]